MLKRVLGTLVLGGLMIGLAHSSQAQPATSLSRWTVQAAPRNMPGRVINEVSVQFWHKGGMALPVALETSQAMRAHADTLFDR
jgi:hypothetical protein